jgi:hypothetical protein
MNLVEKRRQECGENDGIYLDGCGRTAGKIFVAKFMDILYFGKRLYPSNSFHIESESMSEVLSII